MHAFKTALSLLAASALVCAVAPAAALADEPQPDAAAAAAPAMPPLPDEAYLVYVEVSRDGQLLSAAPMMVHGASAHSSFACFDQKISTDGWFTQRFDALFWASLAAQYGDGLPEWSGPAERSAHEQAGHFRLGDICVDVYAPGNTNCRALAWRVDTQGMGPEQLEALIGDPQLGLDPDGDGVPAGPGEYLGSLSWRVGSPDLGYIRDVEATPEQLREMQFGVAQPQL